MVYPQDELGHFPILHTDKLCIMRTRGYAVSPCHAERDTASGFLDSKAFGPQLSIPEALKLVITRALQSGTESRIEMSLQAQDGIFRSAPAGETWDQPLSDWRLDIQDIDGTIHIRLSAALRSTFPSEASRTSRNNYWSAEGPPCRVEIAFHVDPITRVACYGAYIKSLPDEKIATTAEVQSTSVNFLVLEQAPVGTRHQFGIDNAGEWVELYTSPHALSLTPINSLKRSTLGFSENFRNFYLWPGIRLRGIDLDLAASAMRAKSPATLTFSNGQFGDLQQHYTFYGDHEPHPNQTILEVTMSFEIVSSGLKLTYRALVNDFIVSATPYQPGWIDGSVTLSWPVLILRFPQFARYRKFFAAQRE